MKNVVLNVDKLALRLEKKYRESDLIGFALTYAKRVRKRALRIKYPEFFARVKKAVCPVLLTDTDLIAKELGESNTYSELSLFYDYAVIHALYALDVPNPSEDLLGRTVGYLKALFDIEPSELYFKVSRAERILNESRYFIGCDDPTKNALRRRVTEFSKKLSLSEEEAAKLFLTRDPFENTNETAAKLYFPTFAALTVILSLPAVILTRSTLIFFFLILPLSESAKMLTDFIFSHLVNTRPIPKKKLDHVPDSAQTLTVITSLLSAKNVFELCRKIQNCYFSNRDQNAFFGLLCDLPESECEETEEDERIKNEIKKEIESIKRKHGIDLYVFVRKRHYAPSEGKYMGWERKRGAIIELTRLITGKEQSIDVICGDAHALKNVKYLITLDSDTRLYRGALLDMLGAMLHPSNTPVIKNGAVIKGHAILQPRMESSLSSVEKTPFAVLFAGNGGSDVYATAAYETYQSIFDEGIFCGKGILDVRIFSRLIDGAFPDGAILSHDLIEGTRLRAGALTDISLTDDLPKSPLSCFERSHRWIRGDIQALPFAARYVYSSDGRLYKNPISHLSKFKIYDNVRRALVPISSLCALLLCIFRPDSVSPIVFPFALSYLFLPFALSIVTVIKSSGKRFFSFLIPEGKSAFLNLLYSLSSLIHVSLLTTDAVFRSGYRMLFSKKKLLQWKTAQESENGIKGLPLYLYTMLPSMLIGLSLLLFCPKAPLKILGLLSALFPFAAYLMGKPMKNEERLPERYKEELLAYACDMWRFFADNVNDGESNLPPDNIQYTPDEKVAHRTSPTNIGLYLMSCAAAYKMDIISRGEALGRIKNTLLTVEKLQKWNGHLYNWYDTKSLFILGTPYVSSVDSGNFITSLIAVKNLLSDEETTPKISDVISRLDAVINEADFHSLFDERRKLFYIGVNTADGKGEGHYDLFASESRTTSFYAIASGAVRREHWSRLGRITTLSGGYLGLMSWTGTAFEYLMPSLVLPSRLGSLSYEALCFAVREQKKQRTKGVWGRSESGYFHFDPDLNYQYKAFGTPSLGIKRGLANDDVISPYSSFLCLPFAPSSVRRNLDKLKDLGAYGSYGFYEALDFTPSRVGRGYAIIKSYMSHHVGMSIVACANAVLDNIFVRSFMSEPVCASCSELLEEKVPLRIKAVKNYEQKRKDERPQNHFPRFVQRDDKGDTSPRYASMISENGLCAVAMGDMLRLSALKGELSIDPFVFGRIYRPRFLFKADNALYDLLDGKQKYRFGDGRISWRLDVRRLEAELSLSILGPSKTFVFSLFVQGDFKTVCPMLAFVPTLCQSKERAAHPTYSDLGICLINDRENNALIYYRKGKSAAERDKYLAVSFESRSQNASFAARRDILPSMYCERDVEALIDKDFDCADGALINPLCAIKKESLTNGKYISNILLTVGSSMNEVLENINHARRILKRSKQKNGARTAEAFLKKRTLDKLSTVNGDRNVKELISVILTRLCKRRRYSELDRTYLINDLWKHGISGDNPIIAIKLTSDLNVPSPEYRFLTTVISSHKYLSLNGIKLDTVVLYESRGEYRSKTKNALLDACEECGASFFLNRSGGIFTLDGCDDGELFKSISVLYVSLDGSFTFQELINEYSQPESSETVPITKISDTEHIEGDGVRVYHGEFGRDGFKLEKSKKPNGSPPHSFVYAKNHFGTLLNDVSLGYTWIGNCVERRITPFLPDNLLSMSGERLIAKIKDVEYDLCACSHTVTYGRGGAVYEGKASGIGYFITVSVDPFLPCKTVILDFDCEGEDIDCEYRLDPIMSNIPDNNRPVKRTREGDTEYFIPCVADGRYDIGFLYTLKEKNTVCYLLGAYPEGGERTMRRIKEKYRSINDFRFTCKEYERELSALLPDIELSLPDRHLEVMTEYYLPYQALVCRHFGRTGFYQSGGAYGFRDQLQDCLCIMLGAPNIARTHILRCACHQYEEGDVMHWWHVVRGESRGVRTRYTDDLLWLPYVTAKYISFTGDKSVLEANLPYLTSSPLLDHENDRYERAVKSKYRTPLYYHCVRAIERSLNFGSHGLPLMGGGDWNDGMNEVGKGGGESVWLGFFLICVLDAFAPVALEYGDVSGAAKYRRIRDEIKAACEKCFDNGRYLRAFFSDGTPIGGSSFIDILPQAFSVFAKANEKRSKSGLKQSLLRLFDNESRTLSLLDPPFERTADHDPGYISSYPKGVRENGGQYTHAAVWCAIALAECSMKDEAAFILSRINPASICADKEGAERYRGEAYFLAGDVSSNEAIRGRCGWSLYTGASGWFFSAVFTSLMGIRITNDTMAVDPCLSSVFPCYHLILRHKNTFYEIVASRGEKTSYRLDGKETANLFYFDENRHYLEITVENS